MSLYFMDSLDEYLHRSYNDHNVSAGLMGNHLQV